MLKERIMLCTKCGQEYEGSQCPRCDGPVILVNNSDYLARRKAYEEKQALKDRSASSDKKEKSPSDYGQELIKRVQVKKKQNSNKADNQRKMDKQQKGNDKDNHEKREQSKVRIARRKVNKRMKMTAAALAVLVIVCAAAFGIYKLATKKNYALYVSYNGKIYDIAGLDSNYVCDEDKAVFAADGKTFYTPQWPEDIDSDKNIISMASDNGKYFVTVTYDENADAGKYSMYIWNKNNCVSVSSDDYKKEIYYISDEGMVVYSAIDVLDDLGSTAGAKLLVSNIKDTKRDGMIPVTEVVESRLNKAYVYSDKSILVCLNTEGTLYTYNFEKKDKPETVDDAVTQLWAQSDIVKDVYTGNADILNRLSGADTFVYATAAGAYYYDCGDNTSFKIDNKPDADADYIYDKDDSVIYKITGSNIKSALVADRKTGEFNSIDSMTRDKNYIYFAGDKQIVYVNSENILKSVQNNKINEIADNVLSGSLSKVYNKSRAITYIADGSQYYMNNIKEKAVLIFKTDSNTGTQGTHFYKNRIYSYDSDNILYSNTLKGNNSSQIGYVDRLWLGTELK